MPNYATIEDKMGEASGDIANALSQAILAMRTDIEKKYALTAAQTAVAIIVAQLRLLSAAAAGAALGPRRATDAELLATIDKIISGVQPVIGAALEIPA